MLPWTNPRLFSICWWLQQAGLEVKEATVLPSVKSESHGSKSFCAVYDDPLCCVCFSVYACLNSMRAESN